MGRTTILALAGALTLPFVPVTAAAQGKDLMCMQGEYSPAQNARIEAIGPSLSNAGEISQQAMNSLGEIAMTSIEVCAAQHGWNETATAFATLYELGRISEIAYRAGDDLSPREFALIDSALATGNRDRLWSIVEESVIGGMDGEPDPVSNTQAIVLGLFVQEAGLLPEGMSDAQGVDIGERVGVLLGFIALQRVSEREFANQR